MNRIYFVFLVLAGLFPLAGAAGQPEKSLDFLFQSGTEGYHTFRIPAIVTTVNGTVLAFAEGRKNGAADTGDIDLVMRRSADNGRTWSALLLNMRNYDRRAKTRKIARSRDGGITWSNIYADPTLVEPICQASLLNFSNGNDGKQLLLFLNPADPDERRNLTLRVSEDEGHTWMRTLRLWSGPAAYSDMTQLADGALGCLYEAGRAAPYEGIIFRRVAAGELRQ